MINHFLNSGFHTFQHCIKPSFTHMPVHRIINRAFSSLTAAPLGDMIRWNRSRPHLMITMDWEYSNRQIWDAALGKRIPPSAIIIEPGVTKNNHRVILWRPYPVTETEKPVKVPMGISRYIEQALPPPKQVRHESIIAFRLCNHNVKCASWYNTFSGRGFDIFMKCAENTISPSSFVKFNAKLPHFFVKPSCVWPRISL